MIEQRYFKCPYCEDRIDSYRESTYTCKWCLELFHENCYDGHKEECEFKPEEED